MVRIVFCFFADDTGIFEPRDIFLDLLENRTRDDGSDLGGLLSLLFQVLNTPIDHRQTNLDEDLARFPYVNGDLFRDPLRIPSFDSEMRQRLIDACNFNWSEISPAIFGSLFQSVMDKDERPRPRRTLHHRKEHPQGHWSRCSLTSYAPNSNVFKARRDNRRLPAPNCLSAETRPVALF